MYYLINGWFNNNNGLNDGVFYGAKISGEYPFNVEQVVVRGEEAFKASENASENGVLFVEMTSSGGIAIGPMGVLGDPSVNHSRLGLKSAGYSTIDNVGKSSKIPKPGANFTKSKKSNFLVGIGSKFSNNQVSQSGGKKGGNYN